MVRRRRSSYVITLLKTKKTNSKKMTKIKEMHDNVEQEKNILKKQVNKRKKVMRENLDNKKKTLENMKKR